MPKKRVQPKQDGLPGRPRKHRTAKTVSSTFTTYVEDKNVFLAMDMYCDLIGDISGKRFSRSRLINRLIRSFLRKKGILLDDGSTISVKELKSLLKSGSIKVPDLKIEEKADGKEKDNPSRPTLRTNRKVGRPRIRSV